MYEDGERIEDPLMEKQSGKSQTLEPPVLEGTAKRTVFTALICFGFFNVYAMRVNLSEAVLPMQLQYGWSDAEEGYVLSSFFWGYLCGQVIGALLAQKYGGKIVLGCGIFVTSALTLIIPLVSHNIYLLYAVRAIMGLGESVTYPAANVLYTKWAPAKERTFIVTMGSAGAYLGTAFAFPIAGFLIGAGEKKDAHTNMPTPSPHLHPTTSPTTAPTILMYSESWPMVFYVFGALGLVWCMLWFWLASSSPAQHPTITDEEREYIEATVNEDADETCDKVTVTKSENPPIFQMLTHPLAWVLFFNHFTINWGNYTLLTYLPKFLKEVLKFDMKKGAGVAVIPYIAMFVAAIASSRMSDWLVKRTSVRRVRVCVEFCSFIIAAAFLIFAGMVKSSQALAMFFLTISVGASGFAASSYNVSYVDMSPHYAGLFFSIGNTVGNISGVIAPIVAGQILQGGKDAGGGTGHSREAWQQIFYIAAALYLAAAIMFALFMPGKPVQKLN